MALHKHTSATPTSISCPLPLSSPANFFVVLTSYFPIFKNLLPGAIGKTYANNEGKLTTPEKEQSWLTNVK